MSENLAEAIAGEVAADGDLRAKIGLCLWFLQHPYPDDPRCIDALLELITAGRAAERAQVTEQIATAILAEHVCRPGRACDFPRCRQAQADAAMARKIGGAA